MRIVIEIDETLQQPQVTVTSPAIVQQVPGAVQPFVGAATNAGQAPTSLAETAMTEVNVNADVTAPMVAQPGDNSAGAAPSISTT